MNRNAILYATASTLALVGASAAVPRPAFAQEAAVTLEQITVTARIKAENLFETPLSITSLTSDDLERANIRNINDLNNYTPGLYYTSQASFSASRVAPSIRFRGMNNNFADPLQQQGGAFIDGVFLFGGLQSMTFDDVDRVEVIKGPQSALFGRSTFGGAINFITKEPADHYTAKVSASAETHGTYDLTASLEGLIVADKLDFRVSGGRVVKGADFHTDDGGDLGYESTNVINSQLVFKPTDDLKIRVRRMDNWQDDSRSGVVNMNANNPGLANAQDRCQVGTSPFWCGAVPVIGSPGVAFSPTLSVATSLHPPAFAVSNYPNAIVDILTSNKADFPLIKNGLPYINQVPSLDHAGLAGRYERTSLEVTYDFPNNMSFNAAYVTSKMATMTAASSSDDTGAGWIISPNILKDQSIDTRFSSDPKQRFNWSIGSNAYIQSSVGGAAGTGGIVSAPGFSHTVAYVEPAVFTGQGRNLYYGVFGAAHYDIFDKLGADFEGRWQSDRITTSWQSATQSTLIYKAFVPRAILTYKPTDELTTYASWAKGVMPGTINSQTSLYTAALQQQITAIPGYLQNLPEETVQNFELGVKQQTSRWRYAITGYHMIWDNLKNQVNIVCPGNICGPTVINTTVLINIPQQAHISGVETEGGLVFTSHWDANASFDYVRVRTVHLIQLAALAPTGQTEADGKAIYGFPVTQGDLTTTYKGDLSANWGWYVRGDVNYTGRIYVDEINQSWIPNAVKFNAHIGAERGTTRIELYANNIFNNKEWLGGLRGTQSNYNIAATVVSQPTATMVLPRLRAVGIRVTAQY